MSVQSYHPAFQSACHPVRQHDICCILKECTCKIPSRRFWVGNSTYRIIWLYIGMKPSTIIPYSPSHNVLLCSGEGNLHNFFLLPCNDLSPTLSLILQELIWKLSHWLVFYNWKYGLEKIPETGKIFWRISVTCGFCLENETVLEHFKGC
jgi:hypothetical protein